MDPKNVTQREPIDTTHHHLVCWKSIFGGILISIMSYMLLTALGAGIGGMTASHLISNDQSGSGLATGAGLWLGLSAVVSLFLGSYFSLRISNFVTNKVGAAQGFIIASSFFILMIWAAGSGIGNLARGLSQLVIVMGQPAETIASEKAAMAFADAGWSLFVTFVVGLISAVVGGRIGAQANLKRPIAMAAQEASYSRDAVAIV